LAVYQLIIPAEGGMKGVMPLSEKINSPRKKRRGRRGKRAGRKRRALAGSDPDLSCSSTSSKSPRLGRLEKRDLRTRAVLEKYVNVAKLAHRLIRVFADASRWEERKKVFVRYKNSRAAWIKIQSGRAYGSPSIWNTRWEISVHGIDEGAHRAGVDPPPWVYDSRGLKVYRKRAPVSLATATGRFCERCQRSTNMTVCRQCGGDLTGRHRRAPKLYSGGAAQLPRSTALDHETVLGPANYSSQPVVGNVPPKGQLPAASRSKGTR